MAATDKIPITFAITGANRGLGLELCRQILEQDERNVVVGTVRSTDKSQGLKTLQGRFLDRFHVLFCDISNTDSIKRFAAQLEAVLPAGLDYLINNAAQGGSWVPASESALDDLRAVHNTNFIGTLALTQALLPTLRDGNKKTIVNITSVTGTFAFTSLMAGKEGPHMGPVLLPYRTSKAALNLATVLLAQELGDQGFTVVALHPGLVATDLGKAAIAAASAAAGPGAGPCAGPAAAAAVPAISAEASAQCLVTVIQGLDAGKSGGLWDWQGQALQW